MRLGCSLGKPSPSGEPMPKVPGGIRLSVIRPTRVVRNSGWTTGLRLPSFGSEAVGAIPFPAGGDVAGAGAFSDLSSFRTTPAGAGETASGRRDSFVSVLLERSCARDAVETETGGIFASGWPSFWTRSFDAAGAAFVLGSGSALAILVGITGSDCGWGCGGGLTAALDPARFGLIQPWPVPSMAA